MERVWYNHLDNPRFAEEKMEHMIEIGSWNRPYEEKDISFSTP